MHLAQFNSVILKQLTNHSVITDIPDILFVYTPMTGVVYSGLKNRRKRNRRKWKRRKRWEETEREREGGGRLPKKALQFL